MQVLIKSLQTTSLTCLLEPWLRELGFSIFYGSILIKLYRILTEFQTRKAHRVCLRDKDQVVYLVAIVLIVVGYMSAWTALMVDGFFLGATGSSSSSNDWPLDESTLAFSPTMQAPLSTSAHEPAQWAFPKGQVGVAMTLPSDQAEVAPSNINGGPLVSNGAISDPLAAGQLEQPANWWSWARFKREPQPGAGSGGGQLYVLEAAQEQLELLARGLNSFGKLFLGLLETSHQYEQKYDELVYFVRCRKLTWDYVTESSEYILFDTGHSPAGKLAYHLAYYLACRLESACGAFFAPFRAQYLSLLELLESRLAMKTNPLS